MGKRICGWCQKVMGESETDANTHGICEPCLQRELKEVDDESREREMSRLSGITTAVKVFGESGLCDDLP